MLEFRLLGPVELVVDGRQAPLGPAKRRAVLAALAVDAGRPVPMEALIDRVWGEQAPPEARNTVYSHIARLRRLLADLRPDREGVTLVRRSGGYVLNVNHDRVDLLRARSLISQARDPADAHKRVNLLTEALDLWRGDALIDVTGFWAEQVRYTAEEQWLAALVLWCTLNLEFGNHEAVIERTVEAVARHPLAEPLVAVRLRALFRAGRTAEALRQYAATRRRLVEELGAEPAKALQDIHAALLRGDFSAAPPGESPAQLTTPIPRQLPADVPAFVGRQGPLESLDRMHAAGGRLGTVAAVSGTAGVGKTALAVHWAHRAIERFPDGQIYLDLRGYDPDQPITPTNALASMLRSLGVPGRSMPSELADRAALYRTLLADRRMLVVLDNAVGADQVRHLLPGGPSCFTVVTSRDSMAALVARHGARRLELDLLSIDEAVALLRQLVGARIELDHAGAVALAEQCARLPLALRIIAEYLAAHRGVGLAALCDELVDERRRLDLLDMRGEEYAAVRAVFTWSYRRLQGTAAQAFRRLGLNPGIDISLAAVAALFDTSPEEAARLLEVLKSAYLVRELRPGRFTMHDLLRAYARECLGVDPAEDRRAALIRLFDHLQRSALAAVNTALPDVAVSAPHSSQEEQDAARDWLASERENLIAASQHAASHGAAEYVVGLAAALSRDLDSCGRYSDGVHVHGRAVTASQDLGDLRAEAEARHRLGTTHWRLGDFDAALEQLRLALEVADRIGDPDRQAWTLNNAAAVHWSRGDYEAAVDNLERAAAMHSRVGDRIRAAFPIGNIGVIRSQQHHYSEALRYLEMALGPIREGGYLGPESVVLDAFGIVHRRQGRYAEAERLHQQSLNLARTIGDRTAEGHALDSLGVVYRLTERSADAIRCHEQVLAIRRASGDRAGEADALDNLGLALCAEGRYVEALAHHRKALEFVIQIKDRRYEPKVRNGLAEALWAAGEIDEAVDNFRFAQKLAAAMDNRYELARALSGVAMGAAASGGRVEAGRLLSEAAEIFAALGVPEARQVRELLVALA